MRMVGGLALVLVVLLGGCSKDPPCPAGQLTAEWQAAPLAGLVPADTHVCAGASATQVQFWIPETVHRVNIDGVDRAQSSGWNRTRDNWYSSTGDFESPKWSEFSGEQGTLRLDVHEANGGALAELVFTPAS